MINRILWHMPQWLHTLICKLTGYRLVNRHPVQEDGKIAREVSWVKWPYVRG